MAVVAQKPGRGIGMTRGDEIRTMTDEEFAKFLARLSGFPGFWTAWLKYLQSPVEEVDNG